MRFIRVEHLRVHGHDATLRSGRLLIRSLVNQHLNQLDHDDEEKERKKRNQWRQKLRELEDTFENSGPSECLEDLMEVYEDEGLLEPIAKAIEPLVKELKKERPTMSMWVHFQQDQACDIELVEDGHDRVPTNPPSCTIVLKNGHWRWVLGSADEVVAKLLEQEKAHEKATRSVPR